MAWMTLILAGLFEIGWVVGLKYTQGFTRLWPSVATVLSIAVSLTLLGVALRTLPLGTAYAVWTGIGAVGTVAFGIALFDEPASAARLACTGLIVAGIIGLKFTAAQELPTVCCCTWLGGHLNRVSHSGGFTRDREQPDQPCRCVRDTP